jgi:hypothetical protein
VIRLNAHAYAAMHPFRARRALVHPHLGLSMTRLDLGEVGLVALVLRVTTWKEQTLTEQALAYPFLCVEGLLSSLCSCSVCSFEYG